MILNTYLSFSNQAGSTEAEVKYKIYNFRLLTKRDTNGFHPTTSPKMRYAEFTIDAPDYTDVDLYKWFYVGQTASGYFGFEISKGVQNNDMVLKKIEFSGAVCIGVKEYFEKGNTETRHLTMRVSMASMIVYGLTFSK